MGWFSFLEQLAADRAKAADEAASAGLDEVWDRVLEPDFVEAWFAGQTDPGVRLGCARLGHDEASLRALQVEGAASIGPLLLSRLHTTQALPSWTALWMGTDVGRPLLAYLPAHEGRIKALASSSHEVDRDAAFAAVAETGPFLPRFSVCARAAVHGDARSGATLLEAVRLWRRWHQERPTRGFQDADDDGVVDWSEPVYAQFLVEALCHLRVPGVSELLVGLLQSEHALGVLRALAHQADPYVVPAVRAFRNSLLGHPSTTLPLRLGADVVLASSGADVELQAAHWTQTVEPKRYSYPKRKDVAVLQAMAAELFARAGREQAWVSTLLQSDFHVARVAAQRSSPGPLEFWDRARAGLASEQALWGALDHPRSVWRHEVIEQLAERGADPVRLATWCKAELERVHNHGVQDDEDVGETCYAALRVLGQAPGVIDLAGTTSAWIRRFVLEAKEIPPSSMGSGLDGVAIERFDRVPYVLGHKLNGVAVCPNGRTLAVVGENLSRLIDAHTGAVLHTLELRWNWGYAAAWSPDAARVALVFHGGHLEIHEASTGLRIGDLHGHGGVPDGVRCVAWSPDGMVLISGGEDGRLIGWNPDTGEKRWEIAEAGSWQAVAFGPNAEVYAAHVKTTGGEKNFLMKLDPLTGTGERVDQTSSTWCIAVRSDGLLALGGEGKGIQLLEPGSWRTWRKLGTADQRGITHLGFDGDTLFATDDAGGWWRWSVETKKGVALIEAGAPLWAGAVCEGAAWAVGGAGIVHRAVGGALVPLAGKSHARRVIGLAAHEARIVSIDWDGTLLTWPQDGGVGTVLVELGLTPESLERSPRGWVIGTRDGVRLVSDQGKVLAKNDEGELVAVCGDRIAHSDGQEVAFASLPTLKPVGGSVHAGSDDVNALAAFRGGWLAGNEAGQVCWILDGKRRWELWDHGGDSLENGNPHCDVCSIVVTPDERRFVTGATDSIVRVYDAGDVPTLRWRISCGFGLFNRLAIDPSGRFLAIPSSSELTVYDLETGALKMRLTYLDFGHEELAVARFLDPSTLLLGFESGGIFRVRTSWT